MLTYENSTHAFIVRIWLEEPSKNSHLADWRGYITHVLSGERTHVKRLADITAFIAPYLTAPRAEPRERPCE